LPLTFQIVSGLTYINTTLWHISSVISVAKGLSVIGSDHPYLKTEHFPPD